MKVLLKYIVLITLTALLVWGISWARGKASQTVCTQIDVEIINNDSSSFVTPEGVKAEMARLGLKAVGLPIDKINTQNMESKLRMSEYFENVECFVASNGHLVIRVEQIVPVLRVFESDSTSYYLNHNGKHLAAGANFFADVPVVSGNFNKRFPATRLLPLMEYIDSKDELKTLINMVTVRDSANILIVPNIDGHVVNLGTLDNYKSKLDKLLVFYREVLPHKGYNYYDTISLKWDYQVVATKSVKAPPKTPIVIDAEDLEGDTPWEMMNDQPVTDQPDSTLNKTGNNPDNNNKKNN